MGYIKERIGGIAAARDSDRGVLGVGPAATLHGVKVLQSPGVGFTSDVARGIKWTAEQGYDVGNMRTALLAEDLSPARTIVHVGSSVVRPDDGPSGPPDG